MPKPHLCHFSMKGKHTRGNQVFRSGVSQGRISKGGFSSSSSTSSIFYQRRSYIHCHVRTSGSGTFASVTASH